MARMTVTFLSVLTFSSSLIVLCNASEFLKSTTNVLTERVSEDDIRISLLDEVEASLGKGSASNRLSQIEATLRPIVAALPKNPHGNLERSAVSYALQRLFVARHGWVIKGLGTEAVVKNTSSPAGVLKDQVPAYIADSFEQRLAGKGFALRELAILGATIEHLIHNEAVSRLGAVFNVHKLSVTTTISQEEATEVLDTYMMAYIMGQDLAGMTLDTARQLNKAMPGLFLAWGDTQKFVDGMRKKIIKDDHVGDLDFASLARVVEATGEEFGSFQDLECRQMKDALVKMEYRGTGRVRLSDFYRPALEGVWAFQESTSYLRSLGALDETSPSQPSVVLVNYITSPTNCIASSGFYSVCCKNECEGLFGHLEEKIGAPEAKPATIAGLVVNLPSQSVVAPLQLSAKLLQRLDDIATMHKGTVPLHSRLFAQWMHHVYPRECPYPHISGATDSKLPEEWLDASGEEATVTEDEMKEHVARATLHIDVHGHGDLAVEDVTPWSEEQELIVGQHQVGGESLRSAHSISSVLQSMVFLAAAGSLAYGLSSQVRGSLSVALGGSDKLGNEKFMV